MAAYYLQQSEHKCQILCQEKKSHSCGETNSKFHRLSFIPGWLKMKKKEKKTKKEEKTEFLTICKG